PKRFPLLSRTRPRELEPLVAPSKLARVVMVPLPLFTSNTVPKSNGPPYPVVPKRLPLLSSTGPPTGQYPLLPSNEASVIRVGTHRDSSCSICNRSLCPRLGHLGEEASHMAPNTCRNQLRAFMTASSLGRRRAFHLGSSSPEGLDVFPEFLPGVTFRL